MLTPALVVTVLAAAAGLWWWGLRRRRRRFRLLSERGATALKRRGEATDHLDAAEALPAVDVERLSVAETEAPRGGARRRGGSTRGRRQLELGLEAEAGGDAGNGDLAPAPAPASRVLVLYVEVEPHRRITGPEIVDAMQTVGMQYGDMRIFHHHGIGRMRSDRPWFSAANIFEPGEFDLDRIAALETRGVAMFMRLPAPVEGTIAFELLLNTAQRLAEIFRGRVCDERHRALDGDTIAGLREMAGAYPGD